MSARPAAVALALATSMAAVGSVVAGVGAEAAPAVRDERIEFQGASLHLLRAGPEEAPAVLLLHGARFDAATWQRLGTLDALAAAGLRAIALDLPGYGRSQSVRTSREEFLAALLPRLDVGRPVLVSPSMSGRWSLPLVREHPELLSGFVPVAPAGAPAFARSVRDNPLPTLVLWGGADRVFPPSQAPELAKAFQNARVRVFPGASHPAYRDAPEAFHRELIDFVRGLGDGGKR